ncbi:MAG TPA: DUF1727 domain-containing protein [Tissierellia bacterium]|nr:DUF1727 domain-containing protein [Tissierellia bacterium]
MTQRLAITGAKLASRMSRLIGKQGQNLPGTIGLRLSPGILRDLSHQVSQATVMVCGTNGKTTVNNLLADLSEQNGYRVVANRTGANLTEGVAGSYILASRGGRIEADLAFLESDEAWARHTIKHLPVDLMIITNLFRDQLDRYGEIDTTMEYLLEAIERKPDLRLLVNGDDPLCVHLAQTSGRSFSTFGITEPVLAQTEETREATFCPVCDRPLDYQFYHYSQLGHYDCTCGFHRPAIDYAVTEVDLSDGLSFKLAGQAYTIAYRGFYNIYNFAAVIAAFDLLDLKRDRLPQQLQLFLPKAGRNEIFQVGPTRLILNLAKNPAGFNQNLHSLLADDTAEAVLLGINDEAQDGRDVSWLWDVDFERLKKTDVKQILTTGARGADMLLRLKYDGIEGRLVLELRAAIDQLLQAQPKVAYVLVNYTLLQPAHAYLKALAQRSRS